MIHFAPGDVKNIEQTEAEQRFIEEVTTVLKVKCNDFASETGIRILHINIDVYYKEEPSDGTRD